MNIEHSDGSVQRVTEELKNAFVDGELAGGERRTLSTRALGDAELRRQLCELASLKDLVREAYADVDVKPRARAGDRFARLRFAAVALLCVLAGWLARGLAVDAPPGTPAIASVPGGRIDALPGLTASATDRVLLHVSTGDADDLRATLDAAQSLLEEAASASRRMEVEIVANRDGLNLLRAGVSPMPERIARLQARFPLFSLVACNQTIENLRERGEQVTLLPGVRVAPSALDEIVSRLHKGWLYVRT